MEMTNERKFSDAKDKKRDVFLNLVNVNEELPDNAERKLGGGGTHWYDFNILSTAPLVYMPTIQYITGHEAGVITNVGHRVISMVR